MQDDLLFTAGIDREKFKKDVEAISKEILGIEKTTQKTDFTGVVRENLTIQKEAISSLKNDIKDLYSTIEKTAPGISQSKLIAEVKILEAELDGEKKTLIELEEELRKTDEAHRSLGVELQKVRAEMQKLRLEGKDNTQQYRDLETKATKYQAAIVEVNKSITTLSKGGFQPLSSLLSNVSGAFALGAGAVALFTGENENLNRITEKVNAITAIAVGAQNLNAQAMATSATISGFLSNASQRLAVSFGVSTAAARTFLLTITGGLIVAIPALIYLYERYISQNSKLAKTQKDLNDSSKEGVKNATTEITKLEQLYRAATNAAKGMAERKKAVDQLQSAYPNYFKNISDEIIMNGRAQSSYVSLRSAIIAASRAKVAQDKLDEANSGFLDEEMQIRERIKQANLRYRNAKASTEYVRDPNDPKGTILRNVSKAENQARAKREFEDETERLKQLYISRNKTLAPYIKFIDSANKTAKPYIDGLEKLESAKTSRPNKATVQKPKTAEEVAEEKIPVGSVAEIEKRLHAIDEALKKSNDSDVISILKEKRINTAKELAEAEAKISTESKDKEKEALEKSLLQLMESRRNYEEKANAITEKYSKLRTVATTERERNEINGAMKDELSALATEELKKSELWTRAFGDVTKMSVKRLREVLNTLRKELTDNADKYNAADLKTLNDQIDKAENQLKGAENPYKIIKEAIKALGDESLDSSEKIKMLQDGLNAARGYLGNIASIVDGVRNSFTDLGISTDNVFGDILDGLDKTISGLEQTLDGVGEFAAGMATGNALGMVAGGIKAIGGIIKSVSGWISGDNKRDRRIKEWANEVANLKTKYDELQQAVKNSLGEDTYKNQQATVQNLRMQQVALQRMMNEERGKKKSDQGKINEYQNQINAINNQISDIYDNMIQQITQTDAKSLADQLANALIDAYSKGADAAEAYGKAADDVMRNAVKNALKMQLLEKPMQNLIKQLLKNMGFDETGGGSFDGLTDSERDQIRSMMASASQNYMNALEAYSDIFGSVSENAQGLKGDIKGITEKTAGALEAQINAVRINQGESLKIQRTGNEIIRAQLLHLTQIELNTRPIKGVYDEIYDLNKRLKAKGF